MARPYAIKGVRRREDLYPKSLSEKISGVDERKRATKTFIPDQMLALRLAMLGNYVQKLSGIMVRLKNRENEAQYQEELKQFKDELRAWEASKGEAGEDDVLGDPPVAPEPPKRLQVEDAYEHFPSVEAYASSHLQVLEQLASLKGYSLKILTRMEALRHGVESPHESSVELGEHSDGASQ